MIQPRTVPVIPGINNWQFVDTSSLNGDILSNETKIGKHEEDYARTVLTLCYAYRTKQDQMINGSFVLKYREVYKTHIYPNRDLLQNIQNIRNASRQPLIDDDLEKCTDKYISSKNMDNLNDQVEEEEVEEENPITQQLIDSLCTIVDNDINTENDGDTSNITTSISNMSQSVIPLNNIMAENFHLKN